MSYIGNGKSLLIIGSNTKDDLIPDEANRKSSFKLSQEVPGGYESNVTVLRQKYSIIPLIQNSNTLSITSGVLPGSSPAVAVKKVTCTDQNVASILAKAQADDELILTVVGTPSSYYNNTFKIVQVDYFGTSVDIYILPVGASSVESITAGASTFVTASLGTLSEWSILEPEKDYIITGYASELNRIIELTEYPKNRDKVYVLHKGEATYSLSPSVGSVGPEQLSENLRSFVCDRYVGDGTTATFSLSGTDSHGYTVVDAKTLLVTVDDKVLDSDGLDSSNASVVGKWKLDTTRDSSNRQTITFHASSIPGAGEKIRILHLGFSTVVRRAGFSAGQIPYQPAADSVGTSQLQNESVIGAKIAPLSVSAGKLSNNSVTSEKILLANDTAIRSSNSSGNSIELLKLTSDNKTKLNSSAETLLSISGVDKVALSNSSLKAINNDISLGSLTGKFTDAHLSGSVNANSGSFSGNVNVGTINNINITDLKTSVDGLTASIPSRFGVPIGSVLMWPLASTDGDGLGSIPKNWRRCNGQALSTYTFRELHKLISNRYGGHAYSQGTTDVSGSDYDFNLPDLRMRFPVGPNQNSTNVGENDLKPVSDRRLEHRHASAPHTHTFEHTHYVPAHYHHADSGSGSTLQVSVLSGQHTTALDHNHKNLTPNGTTTLDKIDWDPNLTGGSGDHTHTGTTELCDSLEHVHRSWPYKDKSTSGHDTTEDPDITTIKKLGGSQWYQNGVVVDSMSTGYVTEQSQISNINSHAHEINCSDFPSTLNSGHTHSNVDYDIASSNVGDYTVASGVSNNQATPASLVRFSGSVSIASSAKLSEHGHKIPAFYTDFPYRRDETDLPPNNPPGSQFHTDIVNRRTTLRHRHNYTTSTGQGKHSHTLHISYKGSDVNDTNRGLHTHSPSSFSGKIGQVQTINTDVDVQQKTGRAQTGNIDGNKDFSTTGVSKVLQGGSYVVPKTSTPVYGTSSFLNAQPNETDNAVSPHMVFEFIIKVSDNEQ